MPDYCRHSSVLLAGVHRWADGEAATMDRRLALRRWMTEHPGPPEPDDPDNPTEEEERAGLDWVERESRRKYGEWLAQQEAEAAKRALNILGIEENDGNES
jgi:hypothetical protein